MTDKTTEQAIHDALLATLTGYPQAYQTAAGTTVLAYRDVDDDDRTKCSAGWGWYYADHDRLAARLVPETTDNGTPARVLPTDREPVEGVGGWIKALGNDLPDGTIALLGRAGDVSLVIIEGNGWQTACRYLGDGAPIPFNSGDLIRPLTVPVCDHADNEWVLVEPKDMKHLTKGVETSVHRNGIHHTAPLSEVKNGYVVIGTTSTSIMSFDLASCEMFVRPADVPVDPRIARLTAGGFTPEQAHRAIKIMDSE